MPRELGTTRANSRLLSFERLEHRQLLAAGDPSIRSDFDQAFGTEYVQLGDTILFQGSDERYGRELWSYQQGKPTAKMVADLSPGPTDTAIGDMVIAGSRAFFIGRSDETGYSLWATDGTESGTIQIAMDLSTPFQRGLSEFNGLVLFGVVDSDPRQPWKRSYELWSSDGTIAGTQRFFATEELKRFPRRNDDGDLGIGTKNAFHFVTDEGNYYTSDGTAEGTRFVGAIETDYAAELAAVDELPDGTILRFEGRTGLDFRFVSGSRILPLDDDLVDRQFASSTTLRIGDEVFFELWNPDTEEVELWLSGGSRDSMKQIELPEVADAGLSRFSELTVVNDLLVVTLSRRVNLLDGSETTESIYGTFDPVGRTWRISTESINATRQVVVQGNQMISHVSDSFRFSHVYSFDVDSMAYQEIHFGMNFRIGTPKVIGNDAFFAAIGTPNIGQTQRDALILRRDVNGELSISASYRIDLTGGILIHALADTGMLLASVTSGDSSVLSVFDRDSRFQRNDIASSSRQYSGFFFPNSVYSSIDAKRISTTEFVASVGGQSLYVSDGTALGTETVFSPAWLQESQSSIYRFRLGSTYTDQGKVFFTTFPLNSGGTDDRIWALDAQRKPILLFRNEFNVGYLFQILGTINGRLIFATQATDGGRQSLWSSSSEGDGIELLNANLPVINTIGYLPKVQPGSELYFHVGDQALNSEQVIARCTPARSCPASPVDSGKLTVWRTDGTKEGTFVADQAPTSFSEALEFRDAFGGQLLGSVDGRAIVRRSDSSEPTADPVHVIGVDGIERTLVIHDRVPFSRPIVSNHGMFVLLDREGRYGVWRANIDDGSLTPVQHLQFDKNKLLTPRLDLSDNPDVLVLSDQATAFKLFSDGTDHYKAVQYVDLSHHPVGIDSDRLIDARRLEFAEDQFVADEAAKLLTFSSENGQMQIDNEGTVLYESVAAESFIDLSRSGGPVVLKVDSLQEGATKRLLINLPPDTEIRLTGSNVGEIRYTEFNGRLLTQFDGLEVLFESSSGIHLVDALGASSRLFRGSPESDDILLDAADNHPAIKVASNALVWSVTLTNPGAANDISFETSAGSTTISVVDEFFESLSPSNHSISFTSPINGMDEVGIDVSDAFEATRFENRVSYTRSDSTKPLQVTVELTNRPLQNPRQRFDVNLDGIVSPRDALAVINRLMRHRGGQASTSTKYFADVNGDQLVTPLDALVLVNHLHRHASLRLSSRSDAIPLAQLALTAQGDEEDAQSEFRDSNIRLW